jgi:hypothetical protein
MKKMKKALFAVLAAFSLSACDFDIQKLPGQVADTVGGWIDSVKNLITGGGEGEKDKKEEQPCEHQDANHDGVCDLCGETGLVVSHSDANHDHLCDVCGAEVSQCEDKNNDHLCDECGATLSQHKDEDSDFKCDICGEDLKIVDVQLDTSAATKVFSKDSEFSYEGVKVVATSEVGSTQELEFQISQPDMSQVGEQTITVTFMVGEKESSDSYKISIEYWSEVDLQIFDLVSFTSYAPLPYLCGHNMRVEYSVDENQYLTDWYIAADNLSDEDYDEFCSLLRDYEKVVSIESSSGSSDVLFSLKQVALKESVLNLNKERAFVLIPTEGEGDKASRAYVNDEYFVLGLSDEGSLVMRQRMNNALIDAIFYGTGMCNGDYSWPIVIEDEEEGDVNLIEYYLKGNIGYIYSELSAEGLIYPEFDSETRFAPVSLSSMDPFNKYFENFDLAWEISYYPISEETYNNFLGSLVAFGFEKAESEELCYTFSNSYYGNFEIYPSYRVVEVEDDEDPTKVTEMGIATVDYLMELNHDGTNHLTPEADRLVQVLGLSGASVNNNYYSSNGLVIASGSYSLEEAKSGKDIVIDLAYKLLDDGYVVYASASYNSNYKQYRITMANEDYYVVVWADEAASEDGSYAVQVYVYDADEGDNLVSKAEQEVIDMIKRMFGFSPLRDVDYVDNKDGSYSWTLPWGEDTLEDIETVDDLQLFSETISWYIWSSYEQVSSAASEAGTSWVTVYDDVENGLECIAETFVDPEAGAYTVITYLPKVFKTAKSEMISFLTALKGSEPSESDYKANEDGSYETSFALEGEHSAEELQALAEGFVQYFDENYALYSSAASGEQSWAVAIDYEEIGLEAVIAVELGENGASVTVAIGKIPVTPERTIKKIFTALTGVKDPQLGAHYMQYGNYDYYYSALSLGGTLPESYFQAYAETYAKAGAPKGFVQTASYASTYKLDEETSTNSWVVKYLSEDGSIEIWFEIYTNGVTYFAFDVYLAD